MAQPYVIYNGVDTRSLGVWIGKLPDIVLPPERIESIQIYGRPGSLHTSEGKNIYDSYEKTFSIIVRPEADVRTVLNTFRGSGQIIFSNEPNRIYTGRVIKDVKLSREGPWLMTGDVTFEVQPFKVDAVRPTAMTVASGDTVLNPGDVELYPVITLTGNGDILAVTVNDDTFTIYPRSSGSMTYVLDCRNETCVQQLENSTQNANDRMNGNYPFFNVGTNTVTLGENVTAFSFMPDWLYL